MINRAGSDLFVSAGLGLWVREAGVHSLPLLHKSSPFVFFRHLWIQRLICSDIDGLYLQFLMANGTPDSSSGALAPVGVLMDRPCWGSEENTAHKCPCLCGSIHGLCWGLEGVRQAEQSKKASLSKG